VPSRVLPDILTAWNEYTSDIPGHPDFKEYGGIFALSAALTRRVWVRTRPSMPPIYANLWAMLVGRPGSGKDAVINRVSALLDAASAGVEKGQQFYLGEESLSAKGLVDSLASEEAQQSFRYMNGSKREEIVPFHSLIGCVPELTTFMPEYNTQLVGILNELYNCKEKFRERIRGGINKGQRVEITNPHVSLLLGVQPQTLVEIFPEQAFHMGFFARVIVVYVQEVVTNPLFVEDEGDYVEAMEHDEKLWKSLVSDIRAITEVSGSFSVSPDARKAINEFHTISHEHSAVDHHRYEDYNARRSFHLIKMAMVFAMSESSKLCIEMRHWDKAKEALFNVEKKMPDSFRNLVTDAGFHNSVEEIVAGRKGKVVTQREIERTLRRRHKPYEIPQIIRSMLDGRELVLLDQADTYGMKQYTVSDSGRKKLDS